MNIKIAVAHHKQGFVSQNSIFIPIQVGAELAAQKLDMQGDDTGDNISRLNPYYCEMSAMYWLWKNEQQADYLGLCHYRRYFTYDNINIIAKGLHSLCYIMAKIASLFKAGVNYTKVAQFAVEEQDCEIHLIEFVRKIREELKRDEDISFCTKKVVLSGKNIYQHLAIAIGLKAVDETIKIIDESYPQYSKILKQTLNGNRYHGANMIVFKKEIFDEYCSFVFTVLKKHQEKYVISADINPCYLRESGYIAEVLTDIFIKKLITDGHKIKKLNTLFVSNSKSSKLGRLASLLGFFHLALNK